MPELGVGLRGRAVWLAPSGGWGLGGGGERAREAAGGEEGAGSVG